MTLVFNRSQSFEKLGVKVGYLLAYILFTSILFVILTLAHKLPADWSYLHVAGITFVIAFIGGSLKKLL